MDMLPSLTALQSRLGLNEAELRKVVLRLPAVLGYSFEANVLPKLDFMQRELRLSDETLRERVVCNPVILGYSLEGRLRPRVELCRELGLPVERMLFSYHSRKPDHFEALCQGKARGELLLYKLK